MGRIRCWRCSKEQSPAFFCTECGAVQMLPSNTDYLEVLGLPDRPSVDVGALKETWYELTRHLHPDRFPNATPEELRASVAGSALLNAAWQTLRDPESRGRWWLERQSEPLGKNNNQVPPALAALVFEVQEELLEIDEGPGKVRDSLEERLENLESRRESDRTRIEEILQEWPADGDEKSGALADLKNILSELSYLATLVRDIRRALKEA